ncbi:MAG: hypothetical protein QNJ05_08405 [Woeseiaceae bacterium]|nr:hypothetical protein [Woeseiaceae bacterium]
MKGMLRKLSLLLVPFALVACGGGSSEPPPSLALVCDPANPDTHAECGTVLLGLTDADGDFLNYTVDVVSLTLETANGRVVETLPRSTRINFAEYVDLTELFTVATVPPATYVGGSITLDYSDAEVFVEDNGEAREATVIDDEGAELIQASLSVSLSNRDRLVVTRGRPAFLQLDFDLEASHVVDLTPAEATAQAEPFILAEVTPVDEKTIRVRGPIVDVAVDAMSYTVAIRPFRDREGDFGRATVNVTDDTELEVNGEMFAGVAGLEALAAAGAGTPSIALGVLDVEAREFTAERVLAGSSVPGIDRDAVTGNIIARNGNFLTIRGATIIPSDRRAHFHDDVVVEVSENTRVFKDGNRDAGVTIDDLSIGQRVTVRGNQPTPSVDANAPDVLFDATEGAVRMHLTRLSGVVNTVVPGETSIDLQSIDRRRVSIFDFSGTGTSPETDADPNNYQVVTGPITLSNFAEGKPIVAKGFPTAFGVAPPDFVGRTVIDFSDVRSKLGIGWGADGTLAPFLSLGVEGLVLDNENPDIDVRKYIKQGPVLIDLTELPSGTTIVPREAGRTLFAIKSGDSLRLYTDFGDFVEDLSTSLDGATAARAMHAVGMYDAGSNVFTAAKLGILLID